MDRELLKRYLDEGLSLIEIGVLTNRDSSTVGYWVNKFGLEANGKDKYAPRGGLTREQLEPLVESGATLKEMAEAVHRSQSTVRHWMKRHGLELERARRNSSTFREAEAQGLVCVSAKCRRHGVVEFVSRPDDGWRCKRCRSLHVSNARRRSKARLVEWAGGKCVLCGYDRYLGALEFHHKDRNTKEFPLSRMGQDLLVREAHRRGEEVRPPLLELPCRSGGRPHVNR